MSLGRGLYSLLSTSFLCVVSHDYDRAHVGMRTPLRTGLALLTHPAPAKHLSLSVSYRACHRNQVRDLTRVGQGIKF